MTMLRDFSLNALRAILLSVLVLCGAMFWILYVSQRSLDQPEKPHDDSRS